MTDISYNPQEIIAKFDPDNLLINYFNLLIKENKKINLVSRETVGGVLINSGESSHSEARNQYYALFQLAAESLLPFMTIKVSDNIAYLDIGSGGGFPAIPIILTQNLSKASLVERTQKKAGALRRMLLALKKRVDIYPVSFENYKAEKESFDLITLRLVKLTKPMLSEILSLLSPKGTFIYYSKTELEIDSSSYLKCNFNTTPNKSGYTTYATYTTYKRI